MLTMKKIRQTYRVFYAFSIRLLYPAATLLLLAYHLYMVRFVGVMALSLTAGMLFFADIVLDFFVFGGITGKDASYILLKTSLSGRKVLRNGLVLDMLRRFAQYAVTIALSALVSSRCMPELPVQNLIWHAALCTLLSYTLSSLLLNALRYMTALFPYLSVASILSFLVSIVMVLLSHTEIDRLPVRILLALLLAATGILFSFLTTRHVLWRFEQSFHDVSKS